MKASITRKLISLSERMNELDRLLSRETATADLENMPESYEGFRAGAGVWTKAEWQGWLREKMQILLNPTTLPPRRVSVIQ